jgi:hypothetical protein
LNDFQKSWDSKIRSWVSLDSEPGMTALSRAIKNLPDQIRDPKTRCTSFAQRILPYKCQHNWIILSNLTQLYMYKHLFIIW